MKYNEQLDYFKTLVIVCQSILILFFVKKDILTQECI